MRTSVRWCGLLLLAIGALACGPEGGSGGGGGSGGSDPPPPGVPCEVPFTIEVDPPLHGCEIEQGGLRVKLFPLPEGERATRLAVYLHGDGAGEWESNGAFPEVVRWALPRRIVVVAPLAPDSYPGRTDPAYGAASQPRTALAVGAVIADLAGAHGTRTDDLLLWGVSGGSWFSTYSLIPLMGGELQGIFALNCGASQSWQPFAWDVTVAAQRDRFHLLFNHGSEDFLAPNVEATLARFGELGFDLTQVVIPGATHCAHPIAGPTITFWEKHLE